MNPNLCRLALRPRSPLEVFDLGTRFVRARWRPLALLGLLVCGPFILATGPLCWYFEGQPWLLALPLLVAPLIQAPFTMLGGRLMFAEQASVLEVLWTTVKRGHVLVAGWLVALFGWVVGVVTCGLALFATQPALLYLTETALLERSGIQTGVGRTMRLALGHPGVALAGAGARWVLVAWFAAVGEASGHAVVNTVLQLGQPFGSAMDEVVTPYLLIGLLVAQPFIALYRLLLYVDVRTRIEGWDLQAGFLALSTPGARR